PKGLCLHPWCAHRSDLYLLTSEQLGGQRGDPFSAQARSAGHGSSHRSAVVAPASPPSRTEERQRHCRATTLRRPEPDFSETNAATARHRGCASSSLPAAGALFRTPLATDSTRGGESLEQVRARRGTIALSHQ